MSIKTKGTIFEKRIMYGRKGDSNGRVKKDYTVVALFDKDSMTIRYGVAICHPKFDTFNKELGRTIASGRALKAPVVVENISNLLGLQSDPNGKRALAIFRLKAQTFASNFIPTYLNIQSYE